MNLPPKKNRTNTHQWQTHSKRAKNNQNENENENILYIKCNWSRRALQRISPQKQVNHIFLEREKYFGTVDEFRLLKFHFEQ